MKLPFQNSPKFALGDRVSYVVFDKRHSQQEALVHSGQVATIARIIPAQLLTNPYYRLEFADGVVITAFGSELRKI